MKKKTAKQIFESGKFEDLTIDHICQIVQNLYDKNLAKAFFIGMGWPEGNHYCFDSEYVRKTIAPGVISRNGKWTPYWFAIGFMD